MISHAIYLYVIVCSFWVGLFLGALLGFTVGERNER